MDTVTANEEWRQNPWLPQKKENIMIGLGASDMKSGLAASMLYAEKVAKQDQPPIDMFFTFVTREEIDGSGSESFAKWFKDSERLNKYKDLGAIFTEPTGLKEVEHGHRGNYFLLVEARGASGHASRPDKLKKQLAIRKMVKFADLFQEAVAKWNKEFPDDFFRPSITLGEMTSLIANAKVEKNIDEKGEELLQVVPGSPNKFAKSCVATFDLRTTPISHGLLYKRVREIAKEAKVKVKWLYAPAPTGFTNPDEKIVRIASIIGGKRILTVSQASADLGFFTAKGIKSIILGPGIKLQSHKPNEYCYPHQIPQAIEIYKQIVEAWAE